MEAVVAIKSDSFGPAALHIAAKNKDVSEIEKLLSSGADVDVRDQFNLTPLHYATMYNVGESHYTTIEVLLKKGADVNAQNHSCITPLHYLVTKANVKTVKLLLERGADVGNKDNMGEIPLFEAIGNNNLGVIQLLIDHNSDVNWRAHGGRTPLHEACHPCKLDAKTIGCLLKNKADFKRILYSTLERSLVTNHEIVRVFLKYVDLNIVAAAVQNSLARTRNVLSKTWLLITQHVAKLQALELQVHPRVMDIILNNAEYSAHLKECTDELLRAKIMKLEHCWITYFNLLVDSKRRRKNYAGNRDLISQFHEGGWELKFPIYGAQMRNNVEKGIKRRKFFDKSSIFLSECLPIFNPNHLIIGNVLDCITNKHLLKLCQ